mmetsp:Transcript_14485/g.30881  ORF Transcript_14485/g.30881 Transcript_14485/m.30881 type:complete len:373 (+) Transcript_14485:46-1164(+)
MRNAKASSSTAKKPERSSRTMNMKIKSQQPHKQHSFSQDIDVDRRKNVAQHDKRSSTVSTAAASWQIEEDLYPVTRRFSDVNNDNLVFPKVLGSGHYGNVRECVSRRTREVFAVKTIEKCKIARLDHLRREVSILKKMNHGNVMKMIDCYEDEEYVHIVTEKYSGGELFDKIVGNTSENGCFSENAAAKIIKSLLEAVRYLHSKDIIHRDIKPENILFESADEDSDIRLIDFGLSRKHKKGGSPMSTPVGTAYYMSPDVLDHKYGRSSDLWSVGVIAYTILTGYPPFNGHNDSEIFDSIRRGYFYIPPYLSGKAVDFIKCLLRRECRKRFTAEEALEHPWIANLDSQEDGDSSLARKFSVLRCNVLASKKKS